MHVYMHTCAHTHMYVCIDDYIYIYTHMHTCIWVYRCWYIHIYIYIHTECTTYINTHKDREHTIYLNCVKFNAGLRPVLIALMLLLVKCFLKVPFSGIINTGLKSSAMIRWLTFLSSKKL